MDLINVQQLGKKKKQDKFNDGFISSWLELTFAFLSFVPQRKKPSVFTRTDVTIWECQWSDWNWILQPRERRKKNRGGKWKTESHDAYLGPFFKSDTESPCPIHYRRMKFKVRNLAWWEINELHHMVLVEGIHKHVFVKSISFHLHRITVLIHTKTEGQKQGCVNEITVS